MTFIEELDKYIYMYDSLLEHVLRYMYIVYCMYFVHVSHTCTCIHVYRPVARSHDGLTLWLVRWLLFRLMFASGVVKLTSQCPTWWELTALDYHYESQVWCTCTCSYITGGMTCTNRMRMLCYIYTYMYMYMYLMRIQT